MRMIPFIWLLRGIPLNYVNASSIRDRVSVIVLRAVISRFFSDVAVIKCLYEAIWNSGFEY